MRRTHCAAATLLLSASGAIHAADDPTQADIDEMLHRMDMMPEVYGQLALAFEHNNDDVSGGSRTRFKDNHSWIGVRNETEIMPGTEGFARAEWSSKPSQDNAMVENLEYAYLGVEGDFGRVWGGTDDSVFEQELDQVANFFESEFRDQDGEVERHLHGPFDTGRDRLIQYRSPSFGNWQFHGAVQLNEDGDEDALDEERKSSRPYQLITTYSSGAWEWALGMDSNDGDSRETADLDNDFERNNENTYGGRGTYAGESVNVTAQYQYRHDVRSVAALLTSYSIGPNRFAIAWERERDKTRVQTITTNVYSVQVLHDLSENMALYVEAQQAEEERSPMRRDAIMGARYRF